MSVFIEGDKSQFLSKNKVLALKTFLRNESKKEDFDFKKLVINEKDYLAKGSLKISFTKPDFKVTLLTEEEAKREELLRKLKSKSRSNVLRERKKIEKELVNEKNSVDKNLYKKYEKALKMTGNLDLPPPSKMLENPNDMLSLIDMMNNPLYKQYLNKNPKLKTYFDELKNSLGKKMSNEFKPLNSYNNIKEDIDTEED